MRIKHWLLYTFRIFSWTAFLIVGFIGIAFFTIVICLSLDMRFPFEPDADFHLRKIYQYREAKREDLVNIHKSALAHCGDDCLKLVINKVAAQRPRCYFFFASVIREAGEPAYRLLREKINLVKSGDSPTRNEDLLVLLSNYYFASGRLEIISEWISTAKLVDWRKEDFEWYAKVVVWQIKHDWPDAPEPLLVELNQDDPKLTPSFEVNPEFEVWLKQNLKDN